MFCSAESLAQAALPQAAGAKPWLNLGRAATDAEVKAWDIDVRADFVGLPKGAGSVSKGEEVWEAKCASCHGTFGESNEVFTPIVGGTTKKDIEAGLVANLTRPDFPQRHHDDEAVYRIHLVGLHQSCHAMECAKIPKG